MFFFELVTRPENRKEGKGRGRTRSTESPKQRTKAGGPTSPTTDAHAHTSTRPVASLSFLLPFICSLSSPEFRTSKPPNHEIAESPNHRMEKQENMNPTRDERVTHTHTHAHSHACRRCSHLYCKTVDPPFLFPSNVRVLFYFIQYLITLLLLVCWRCVTVVCECVWVCVLA